jgi:hypothetical protein
MKYISFPVVVSYISSILDGYQSGIIGNISKRIRSYQKVQSKQIDIDQYAEAIRQRRQQELNVREEKKVKRETSQEKKHFWVGVFEKDGKRECFFKSDASNVPASALFVKEVDVPHSEIGSFQSAFHRECKGLQPKAPKQLNTNHYDKTIRAGNIIHCSDGDGNHVAVVTRVGDEFCGVVMLTSNPFWNDRSRQLTKDEEKFFSFPKGRKDTFFAPTVVSVRNIHKVNYDYPPHRLNELIEEFK